MAEGSSTMWRTTGTGQSREHILLLGHYHSKVEFLAHIFEKLAKVLPRGAELHVERALSTNGTVGYVDL